MKYFNLTSDSFETSFSTLEDFLEFIKDRKANSEWIDDVKIYGIDFAAVPNGPLFLEETRDDLKLGAEVSDEAILSTMEGTQMATKFDGKTYLLSEVAVASLVNMLIGKVNMFNKLTTDNKLKALEIFQTAVSDPEKGKKAIMLYSYGKARTFQIREKGAKTYNVLNQDELINALMSYLNENFEGNKFMSAYYTHNNTSALWSLPEQTDDLMSKYLKTCHAHGITSSDEFVPALRFETSDTGFQAVTLKACLMNKKNFIPIGSTLKLDHMNGHKISDFVDMLSKVFVQFKDLVENLERLLTVEIKHPTGCLKNLGTQVGIPATFLDDAIEFFEIIHDPSEEVTAHDIFFALHETLLDMQNAKVAESTIEKVRENLTRAVVPSFSWNSVDHRI